MKKRTLPSAEENMMMSDITAARREEFESALDELTAKAPPPMPMALAVREGEIRNTKVHIRGDPERLGDEVPRGFLSLIDHVQSGALGTASSGRLALAQWIAHDQNPLTARVLVNRLWLYLFGRGLVGTPDNFGSMGELPSHPELLDYLASEFMKEGWSTKKMVRRLMLCSTYQLSSEHHPEAFAADPENRLLWRMNRRRLDAESLRDSILAVNSTLERTIGGELATEDRPDPGSINRTDLLASRRRTLYLPVFRGNLNDLYQVFDFPDPNALAGKRFVTTAPTQALFLMNSPFITGECKTWAGQLLAQSGKSEIELLQEVYLKAYARPCTAEEQQRASAFLEKYRNGLIAVEPGAANRQQKALQAFCHAILESTEFRFLN